VSESTDVRITGFPPARTDPDPPDVTAEQCRPHPGAPQHGCGVTDMLGTTTGRRLTRTLETPPVATPPDEFASPCRCTAGMLSHDNFFVRNTYSCSGFDIFSCY
jgi:hypothetical protein